MRLSWPKGAGISCLRLIRDGPAATSPIFTSPLVSACTMAGFLSARIRPFPAQWSAWSVDRSCPCIRIPCTTSKAAKAKIGIAAVAPVTSLALTCGSLRKPGI